MREVALSTSDSASIYHAPRIPLALGGPELRCIGLGGFVDLICVIDLLFSAWHCELVAFVGLAFPNAIVRVALVCVYFSEYAPSLSTVMYAGQRR